MGYLKYKKRPDDKLILFLTFMVILSFVLTFLIAWLFPKLPWKELGGLFIYGIFFLGLTIFSILSFFQAFQKKMIGVQILTGTVLFIIYFAGIAVLVATHIIELPRNTWVYTGIFFIFYPLILFPALYLEYEYIIKKLSKRNKKVKKDMAIEDKNQEEKGVEDSIDEEFIEEKKEPLDITKVKTYIISIVIFAILGVISFGCTIGFDAISIKVGLFLGGMIGFVVGFVINVFSGR